MGTETNNPSRRYWGLGSIQSSKIYNIYMIIRTLHTLYISVLVILIHIFGMFRIELMWYWMLLNLSVSLCLPASASLPLCLPLPLCLCLSAYLLLCLCPLSLPPLSLFLKYMNVLDLICKDILKGTWRTILCNKTSISTYSRQWQTK